MTEIANQLKQAIRATGVITLARFMDIALYCPKIGYYEHTERVIGRSGDFYTSVSTGPLFGELLAFQFAEWLDQLSATSKPLHLVEAGAHDGQLAFDILNWLSLTRADLLQKCEYWIIEPSPTRQERQRGKLEKFAAHVKWFSSVSEIGRSAVHGIIFSNELLDAFPVHRFAWDAADQTWCELGVGLHGDNFVWAKMGPADCGIAPREISSVLPDGFIVDFSPAASEWWREAASMLGCGKLLTIDYGLTEQELFTSQHAFGTLRAYYRHHISDPLSNPGEQDITSHVNFSEIQHAGESAGLRTEHLSTQAQFLVGIAEKLSAKQPQWTPAQMRQFQTLVHPEFLGRKFRVIIQSR